MGDRSYSEDESEASRWVLREPSEPEDTLTMDIGLKGVVCVHLPKAVAELGEAVQRLSVRLGPVLGAVRPQVAAAEADVRALGATERSALYEEANGLVESIRGLSRELVALQNRVDI